jgi:hypothetical protein
MFLSSGEESERTTLLGPLMLALSKEPNRVGVSPSLRLKTGRHQVSEMLRFLINKIPDDGQSPQIQ